MKKSLEEIQEDFKKMSDEHMDKIKTFWDSLDEESKKGLQYYSAIAVGDKNTASISTCGFYNVRFMRNVNDSVVKEALKEIP